MTSTATAMAEPPPAARQPSIGHNRGRNGGGTCHRNVGSMLEKQRHILLISEVKGYGCESAVLHKRTFGFDESAVLEQHQKSKTIITKAYC